MEFRHHYENGSSRDASDALEKQSRILRMVDCFPFFFSSGIRTSFLIGDIFQQAWHKKI